MKARRWWIGVPLLLAALLIGAWLIVRSTSLGQEAAVGTGYAAHVVCSCRYVGDRDMASCRTDFEPGMEIVEVEDDPERRRITAWVPLLAKRTASYDPEYGCTLDAP